jgi:hypothetical protein
MKLELVRSEDFVFNSAIRSVYGQGDDDFKYFLPNLALYPNQSTFGPFQKLCPNLVPRVGAGEEGSEHV